MRRTLSRSLVRRADESSEDTGDGAKPDATANPAAQTPPAGMKRTAGAGSAWKAGALAQSQGALDQTRQQLAADMLSGHHEFDIPTDQVSDPIGTDRRDDWRDQDAFRSLLRSIEENGQDTPIRVWPEDPNWRPDPLDPTNVKDVSFLLLTGRRRHAAAASLGRPVRAVIAPADQREGAESMFEMLFIRFRENEERENLGAFERLVSIGELYESLAGARTGNKLTAVEFADRIGVHESLVSRARSVFKIRDEILNAFKNAYDMSFRELQDALATLKDKPRSKAKPRPRLKVTRKVGTRTLSIASKDDGLTIRAAGLRLDQSQLEVLGDLIAEHLTNKTPNPET